MRKIPPTVRELSKIRSSLPGRHCKCGALRAGNDKRCEKCQARAGWYRHNCRRPRRTKLRAARGSIRTYAPTPTLGQHRTEES
jgi:hypothetical protein